jgi:hypothetical protein
MPTPLEDKEAIRELFSEYCFRMDAFQFTELGELFTEDGEWIAPYSRARGPGEIAALMARNIPAEPRRKQKGPTIAGPLPVQRIRLIWPPAP